MAVPEKKITPKVYDYDNIVITLDNCILPSDKVDETPSMKDGLDRDTENDLRIFGCELVQTAGLLLKLPQVAMATGQVLLQRFYYSKSLIKHDIEVSSMAAVYLAAKIEEAPRRIRDIINVCHHIKQKMTQKQIVPMDFLGSQYFNLKAAVIKAERRILIELGFCVHVKHPHKIIITYLPILELEKNAPLARKAWNFMNDSLRTDVFVRFTPEKVACACIFLAARVVKINLPLRPPWWELFDATYEELEDISLSILRLYSKTQPRFSSLLAEVNKIKKANQEKKDDVSTPSNTPGSFTPSHTPSSLVNNNNNKPSSKTNTPEKEKKLCSVIAARFEHKSSLNERNSDSSNRKERRRRKSESDSSNSDSDSNPELPSMKYAQQRRQYESKKRSSPGSSDSEIDLRRKIRRSLSPSETLRHGENKVYRNGYHRTSSDYSKSRRRSRSPGKRHSSKKYSKGKARISEKRYRDKYLNKVHR